MGSMRRLKKMRGKIANNNNTVNVSGVIISGFEFSHEVYGEKFYVAELSVMRLSGQEDIIPLMVSDRMIDVSGNYICCAVSVFGQFRSYNKHCGTRSRLCLYVFAQEISFVDRSDYTNKIVLDGYICKTPNYRETPFGREIADMVVAANRPYGKSDYIPCITWGRNAKFSGSLEIGTHLYIEGRIQSREYQKKISVTEGETRVAYEVSVTRLEIVEDEGK